MGSGWHGGTGGGNDAVQGHVIGHVGAVINRRAGDLIELKTSHEVVLRRVPQWAGRGSGGIGRGGRSQMVCSCCSGGDGSMRERWIMGLDVVGRMRTPIGIGDQLVMRIPFRIGGQLVDGGRSREKGGRGVVAKVFSDGGNVLTDGLQLGVHVLVLSVCRGEVIFRVKFWYSWP